MHTNPQNNKDIINLELLNVDNTKIINQYQWNYTSLPYLKNLFQIEEKYVLIILFNYRREIKNNQLTIDLSRLESYSFLDKEKTKNNQKKNNNSNIIIKDEKLSQLLNDELSEFSESLFDKDKKYFKDKKVMIKRVKTVNLSKNKNYEIREENKISDEDKSKDKINILYDNDKSSIFNLDFTYISKNDIGLYDSFKLDKNSINNKELSNSMKKKSKEIDKNNDIKINNLNLKKNPINKKNNIDNNNEEKEKENTNINLSPVQVFDKSNEEKDKKDLNKKFLDFYQDTISSEERYYKYENKNKSVKEDK